MKKTTRDICVQSLYGHTFSVPLGSKDTKEGASEEVPRTTEAEQQETGHSVSAMEV